jgi:hypothetical protein
MTYSDHRTGHTRIGTESDRRVLMVHLPLGQTPSLRPLRSQCSGLVRRLRRYYGPVRLPMVVHCRCSSLDLPTRPTATAAGVTTGSPGSRARCFRTCLGPLTSRGSQTACGGAVGDVAFRVPPRRRHPEVRFFRGSIPSLHMPLSTLRRRPCGRSHMTRGQRGLLDLHCVTLSFTTPCRFIPAHRRSAHDDSA